MLTNPDIYGADDLSIVLNANSFSAGSAWDEIEVPDWARLAYILLWGGGGPGGNGAVGANSAAAGGGGGGSSAQTSLLVPTRMLPRVLYASIGMGGAVGVAGISSRISIYPDTTTNNTVAIANGGAAGGNAAGATAGAAGAAGSIASLTVMPMGGCGVPQFLVGQAGIIGGVAVAGAQLTTPNTGLFVTGGTGGGGLPAAAAAGTNGGPFSVAGWHPPQSGGIGPVTATVPGGNGSHGWSDREEIPLRYGGTGGGSTHGTATGAGLAAGNGGVGGQGCGGGGGGGGLTGSTQGLGGRGGDGQAIIIFI